MICSCEDVVYVQTYLLLPFQSVVIWCDLLGDIQSGSDALPRSGSLLPHQVPGGRAAA